MIHIPTLKIVAGTDHTTGCSQKKRKRRCRSMLVRSMVRLSSCTARDNSLTTLSLVLGMGRSGRSRRTRCRSNLGGNAVALVQPGRHLCQALSWTAGHVSEDPRGVNHLDLDFRRSLSLLPPLIRGIFYIGTHRCIESFTFMMVPFLPARLQLIQQADPPPSPARRVRCSLCANPRKTCPYPTSSRPWEGPRPSPWLFLCIVSSLWDV